MILMISNKIVQKKDFNIQVKGINSLIYIGIIRNRKLGQVN